MITFNVTGFLTDFTDGQSQIIIDTPAATVKKPVTLKVIMINASCYYPRGLPALGPL